MPAPVIILTGPPGVGKSTVASMLEPRFDPSAVLAGDFFLDALRTGKIPPWESASHDQNTHIIDLTVRTAAGYADAGWTTVLEGILGPWFLANIEEQTHGYDVHYIVLHAPLAVCLRRAENRGPDLDAGVVAKMHGEFTRCPVDARHRVDADRGPVDVAADILDRIERRTAVLRADPAEVSRTGRPRRTERRG